MRVTALVSLILALSVSSLPVSNPLGSAGGVAKSTLDKATSNPATHGLPSRALPGDVADKVDPNQVKQVENKVTSATKGTPNPANVKAPGAVGQGLNGVTKSAQPGSRRDTAVSGVTDKLKGTAGSTEDKAKGAASGPKDKVTDAAPKGPGGVVQRAAVSPPPGLGGAGGNAGAVPAEVQQEITNIVSKIAGATTDKGAPSIPGSAPVQAP